MTARNLTALMLTEIAKRKVLPILLYEGEFVEVGSPSETPAFLRMWTGYGSLSWDSKTWIGGGKLVAVQPPTETRDLNAQGFTATISGLDSAVLAVALTCVRQGRPGKLWLGLLDATTGTLIADPYLFAGGKLDIVVTEDNGETASVSVQYESRLVDLEKPRNRYYTSEDQALDYPADTGFRFVPSLQNKIISWGA